MSKSKKRKPPVADAPPLPSTRGPSLHRRAELAAAAELDRICAARPLKPPPMRFANLARSAGARELSREIRAGEYEP